MKTFEQLAQSAYAAYCKRACGKSFDAKPLPTWAELPAERQACWRAVAKHLVAEVAALH